MKKQPNAIVPVNFWNQTKIRTYRPTWFYVQTLDSINDSIERIPLAEIEPRLIISGTVSAGKRSARTFEQLFTLVQDPQSTKMSSRLFENLLHNRRDAMFLDPDTRELFLARSILRRLKKHGVQDETS